MKSMTIGPNDAGQRLDKFLGKAVPTLPKSLLYKSVRLKRVKRNGKRCEISTKLQVGDVVDLYLNDEFFRPRDYPFLAAPPNLSILFEDENILLLDKQPGLLVHEDDTGEQDTLIHRLQHYLYRKGEYNPARENSFAPALCNRIDRNTGGIVIAAKNFAALQMMSEKIKNRELTKLYLCAVHGVPEKKLALLRGYHQKDAKSNLVKISPKPSPGAKTALTKYRVLKENPAENLSLLEVELLTGRTHQIRAHLATIGHPLLGDTKYGLNRMNKKLGYKSQALYSYKLHFSFKSDAGVLEYLKNKQFEVSHVPFLELFS